MGLEWLSQDKAGDNSLVMYANITLGLRKNLPAALSRYFSTYSPWTERIKNSFFFLKQPLTYLKT